MDMYYTNSKVVCDTWILHSNEDILRTDNRTSGDNISLLPGVGVNSWTFLLDFIKYFIMCITL